MLYLDILIFLIKYSDIHTQNESYFGWGSSWKVNRERKLTDIGRTTSYIQFGDVEINTFYLRIGRYSIPLATLKIHPPPPDGRKFS